MPCTDKDDHGLARQTMVSQAAHHESHADETCPPFCVCSCCTAHFLVLDRQPMQMQVALAHTVYTDHPVSKVSAADTPIWQPPKLG